jgi:hypothetical protein
MTKLKNLINKITEVSEVSISTVVLGSIVYWVIFCIVV